MSIISKKGPCRAGRLLCALLALALGQAAYPQTLTPPEARIIPKVDTVLNHVRVDNYFWLRERDNPDVTAYLQAENQYTDVVMKPTEKLQEKLFIEMRRRIKESDFSVPAKKDSFYYYYRTEEGRQYGLYCRKLGSLNGPEQVLLDENQLAVGHPYFSVGTMKVSPDHRYLAYAVDTTGREIHTLYVKDLIGDSLYPETISNAYPGLEWAGDSRTLFYVTFDHILRPYKLFRHVIGTSPADDRLVFHEPDEAYNLTIEKTKSKKYLVVFLEAIDGSEVHYLPADDPNGDFTLLTPRRPHVEYYLEHSGDNFYILTNEEAENFRVFKTSITDPSHESWQEIIPPRDSVFVTGLEMYRDFMIILERYQGVYRPRVMNLADGQSYYIEFPEPIYMVWSSGEGEYEGDLFRFVYTSLVMPSSIYDYNMRTQQRTLLKRYEVLGGFDPSQYVSERIFAKAADGAMIPISLVYRKGMKRDGGNPLYLYGYGAYGYSSEPTFHSSRLSLIDRGFIFAIAHVRGGSEMGRYWYDQGKLFNKRNTFTDFIACAEHLVKEKYTSADRLVAQGASAGGLLMGAIANMRPDLFRVIVADVPFVDVINTMLDPTIPLTVNEYDEWGNPGKQEDYDYMMTYSPYDNVKAQNYPALLIRGSMYDASVQYWEPAKWTAKLRALKTDHNRLLLKINMEAGHGGASGRFDSLRETAFEFAFILDVLGIKK